MATMMVMCPGLFSYAPTLPPLPSSIGATMASVAIGTGIDYIKQPVSMNSGAFRT
jgi:hypothetical protein